MGSQLVIHAIINAIRVEEDVTELPEEERDEEQGDRSQQPSHGGVHRTTGSKNKG